MSQPVSNQQILTWEVIGICFIVLIGGPLHEVFDQSGRWRPLALIAPVNESIWEHLKMFFWPGLLYAAIEYLRVGKRIPNYWFGKLIGLIVTPAVSVVTYVMYLEIERASGYFSPSNVVSASLSALSVCVGQAFCYRVLTAVALPEALSRMTRFMTAGYVILILAFSTFTYFPPELFLFEQNHHYEPIGQYGIDADPQVGAHPWDLN
jgi:hypothetical protein